jgi:hypothetical protein
LTSPFIIGRALSYQCSEKQKQQFKLKTNKSYVYTAVMKVLSGWVDQEKNKQLFSIRPWRLEAIFIGP